MNKRSIVLVKDTINTQVTNGVWQVVSDYKQVFFAYHPVFLIRLFNVLKVSISQFNDISAQVLLLYLV